MLQQGSQLQRLVNRAREAKIRLPTSFQLTIHAARPFAPATLKFRRQQVRLVISLTSLAYKGVAPIAGVFYSKKHLSKKLLQAGAWQHTLPHRLLPSGPARPVGVRGFPDAKKEFCQNLVKICSPGGQLLASG